MAQSPRQKRAEGEITEFRRVEYEALRTEIVTLIGAADRVCYFVVGANAAIASWLLVHPDVSARAAWLPLAVAVVGFLFWASKARGTRSIGIYIKLIEAAQSRMDGLTGWESSPKGLLDRHFYISSVGLYVFWIANGVLWTSFGALSWTRP